MSSKENIQLTSIKFSIIIPITKNVSQTKFTQGTIKDPSTTAMPEEITTLIRTLQTSFNTHRPRILEIYTTIQDLAKLSPNSRPSNQQTKT
jgi:hypothetical protein